MSGTDTIARFGRAPAVTLVAATRRPTRKVMGQGAVRSQMNIRISFRVEEQRDVVSIHGVPSIGVSSRWGVGVARAFPRWPCGWRRVW